MLASTIDLDKCYQLLGLHRGASFDDLKSAYRSLARQSHPDLHPDDVQAHQRFIALNQAYQLLLDSIPRQQVHSTQTRPTATVRVHHHSTPPRQSTPELSKYEAELKSKFYYELQSLLKQQQFLKAIPLIEGLAQRLPHDRQICQWQGIVYSQFGYQLIKRGESDRARIYLRKAIRVDPHNKQLWQEVDRAFNRIAQLH